MVKSHVLLSSHHPLAVQHLKCLNALSEHDLSMPSCYRDAAFVIQSTLLVLSYSLDMRQKYGHRSIPYLFDVKIFKFRNLLL